jgi:hypothetical protein
MPDLYHAQPNYPPDWRVIWPAIEELRVHHHRVRFQPSDYGLKAMILIESEDGIGSADEVDLDSSPADVVKLCNVHHESAIKAYRAMRAGMTAAETVITILARCGFVDVTVLHENLRGTVFTRINTPKGWAYEKFAIGERLAGLVESWAAKHTPR